MIPTVPSRDTERLPYRANMDLTGAQSVVLVAKLPGRPSVDLPTAIVDAVNGEVEYVRDGALPPGVYSIELQVVTATGRKATFPNEAPLTLTVRASL
ncbi:hypothetical protein [Microbacterium maritypicum]